MATVHVISLSHSSMLLHLDLRTLQEPHARLTLIVLCVGDVGNRLCSAGWAGDPRAQRLPNRGYAGSGLADEQFILVGAPKPVFLQRRPGD